MPDGGSYLFRLDLVINGSQINLVLELDWANRLLRLRSRTSYPIRAFSMVYSQKSCRMRRHHVSLVRAWSALVNCIRNN